MDLNRRTYTLVLLVMLVLIIIHISGCFSAEQPKSREILKVKETKEIKNQSENTQINLTEEEKKPFTCAEIENIPEKDACYRKAAIDSKNETECKKIYSKTVRDSCYMGLATSSDSKKELCFLVEDADVREECYFNVGITFKDISFCKRLSNSLLLKRCVQENFPICNSLLSEEEINKCLSIRANSYEICGSNVDCLIEYANNYKDLKACDNISNISEQRACYSLASDSDYCASLTGFERDKCYFIAGSNSEKISFCKQINPRLKYAQQCIDNAAIKSKNFSLCHEHEDSFTRNECYYNYALTSLDYTACEAITVQIDKVPCFQKIAYATSNPSICNYIENSAEQSRCYGNIIFGEKKYSLDACNKILSNIWKATCITNYAFAHKDASACQLILEDELRQECIQKAD